MIFHRVHCIMAIDINTIITVEIIMSDNELLEDILAQPKSVEDLDIPQNILIDIILRLLYTEGNVDFRRMAQVLRVPHALEQLLDWLRNEHLVEGSQSSASFGPLNY